MKKIILPIFISTPLVILLNYYLFLSVNYTVVFAILACITIIFSNINIKKIKISKFEMTDDGELFNDLNIVLLTDLNISKILGKYRLKAIVEKVNNLKPDIIILTGNIIGHDLKSFFKKNNLQILRALNYKYGIFTVLKNNEIVNSRKKQIIHELDKCNIRLLIDDSILINDEFYLADRYDSIFISSGDGLWAKPLMIGSKNEIINIKIKATNKEKLNIKIKEILEK